MVWTVQQDETKSVVMSKFVIIQLFLLALYCNMLFAFTIPYMKFIYNFYCFKQKKKIKQVFQRKPSGTKCSLGNIPEELPFLWWFLLW